MNTSIVVCPNCNKKVQAPSGYSAFLCPYCKSKVALEQPEVPQPKPSYVTKRTVRTPAPAGKSNTTIFMIGGCVIGLLLILVIVLFLEISSVKSETASQKQQFFDVVKSLQQENEKLHTQMTKEISEAAQTTKQEVEKTKEELESAVKITPLGNKIRAIVKIVSPPIYQDENGDKVGHPSETFNGYVINGSSGTGEIINEKGYIVTNKHVIKWRKQQIKDGKEVGKAEEKVKEDIEPFDIYVTDAESNQPIPRYIAKFVCAAEGRTDLAVIKIIKGYKGYTLPSEFEYIKFGDASKVRIMDTIFVHGYPAIGGDTLTSTRGSCCGREMIEGISNAFIKTDACTGHGNSGGAALNTKGEFIGIPTLLITGEMFGAETAGGAMGYLINGNVVKQFLKEKSIKYYDSGD